MTHQVLPIFDGKTNFLNWAHQVSYHFRVNDVWEAITGIAVAPSPLPEDASDIDKAAFAAAMNVWRKLNDKAISMILVLLENNIVTSLRTLGTAKEIWDRLHAIYTKGSSNHAQHFRQKLHNFKFTSN